MATALSIAAWIVLAAIVILAWRKVPPIATWLVGGLLLLLPSSSLFPAAELVLKPGEAKDHPPKPDPEPAGVTPVMTESARIRGDLLITFVSKSATESIANESLPCSITCRFA